MKILYFGVLDLLTDPVQELQIQEFPYSVGICLVAITIVIITWH